MVERVHLVGDSARPTRVVEDPHEIDNPILEFFVSYWARKRETNGLPRYASFVPKEVKQHLPWVVVSDALPDYEDFRYRVVGSRVAQYFLGDGTGKTIREAFEGLDAQFVEGVLWLNRQTCVERVPIRLTAHATVQNEIYFPACDTIYLPYSTDGIVADKVVNVFTFSLQSMVKRIGANLS